MQRIRHHYHKHVKPFGRILFWFSLGGVIGLFFFISFLYIFYQQQYQSSVYPGIFVNGIDFGGKTQQQVKQYFDDQNAKLSQTTIQVVYQQHIASSSAVMLHLGYGSDLLSQQAMSLGRSPDLVANLSILLQAYTNGVRLSPAYRLNDQAVADMLAPLQKQINKDPVNASFTFINNRVTAFQLSQDGRQVDINQTKQIMLSKVVGLLAQAYPQSLTVNLPVEVLKPNITTDSVNNYGIKELVASGTSLFAGSIQNRVFNVGLAASRINGALIAPGEIFSFDKTVGDISSLSGYKQAYVIENGHTVLGDGGGVCQVSTTLFRAILNAGLPIIERHPHAYEVHYYTEDAPLGFDASVYIPTYDLKFKNDTDHYILIQSVMDAYNQRLTFNLYGTKDDRQVNISQPVISDQSPAPEPLYQDDPTQAKGVVQQVDFAAPGAKAVFTRTVTRGGKTILADTFVSVYRPWQAVFLRGTK